MASRTPRPPRKGPPGKFDGSVKMSNSRKGASRERKVIRCMMADPTDPKNRGRNSTILGGNWPLVERTKGSHGAYDIFAMKKGQPVYLIQIKATAAGPFTGFPPKERDRLRNIARITGAVPLLIWWPYDGKGYRLYDETQWPDAELAAAPWEPDEEDFIAEISLEQRFDTIIRGRMGDNEVDGRENLLGLAKALAEVIE